jgi:hypothetical protein
MGLVGQAPATVDLAYGTQAVLCVPMFLGAAAENVIAHLPAIEAFVQSQLPSAPVVGASSTNNVNPDTHFDANPTLPAAFYRPITTPPAAPVPFVPSNYNTTSLHYSFNLNYGAAGASRIVLYADPVGHTGAPTARAVAGGGSQTGAAIVDCSLSFDCPPTWVCFLQLEASPFGGGPLPTVVEAYFTEESWRP